MKPLLSFVPILAVGFAIFVVSCKTDSAAITALKRVDAATATGGTMMQFQDRLADAKVEVDKSCPEIAYPKDTRCSHIRGAYGWYEVTLSLWQMGVKPDGDGFRKAREELNKL